MDGLKSPEKGNQGQFQGESVILHNHVTVVGNPYQECTTDELIALKTELSKTKRLARKRITESKTIDVKSESFGD